MTLRFFKYQGTGNDFIIADNRSGEYSQLTTDQIRRLCDRRFGIGADGFMLLNDKPGYDIEMKNYNPILRIKFNPLTEENTTATFCSVFL